jgi:hypothetical protein
MASTYSTSLKLELIGNGDQSGTWGTTTNTNLGTLLEQAITGVQSITMANADVTLTSLNGASDQARNAVLVVGGTNAAIKSVIAPAVEKLYVIKNATVGGYDIVIKTSSSTGITIANGTTVFVYCDGTEFYTVVPPYSSSAVANTLVYRDGSGDFSTHAILTADLGVSGTTILGDASGDAAIINATATINSLSASSAVATNASKNLVSVTNTGSGNNVLATSPTLASPTLVTPVLGTPTSGTLTNCTGYTYANLTGTVPTWNQNTTGSAATAGSITNSGGWNVTPSGTTLYFNYNGTNVAKLTSAGVLTVAGDVVSNGTV